MTDIAKKGELLLSDMSEPLALMAQANEALSRAVIPEEVLEWLGVTDDTFVSRLDEACNEIAATVDSAEKGALVVASADRPAQYADDFERAVKGCLDDLTAVEVPGAAEVDEWVRSLTAAFEMRLRKGSDDFLEASVHLRFAKEAAIGALEGALR